MSVKINYETEVETISKPAEAGDMVVARNDNGTPAETWLVKAAKFPTLYETTPINTFGDWAEHKTLPQTRNALLVDEDLVNLVNAEFALDAHPIPQEAFLEYAKTLVDLYVKVQKCETALVRPAKIGEQVVTRVKANPNPDQFVFVASWGETQPAKLHDVIIVMDDSVYRIARAEFNQTYVIVLD